MKNPCASAMFQQSVRGLGHAAQRPVVGRMLDQRAAPYASRQLGKIDESGPRARGSGGGYPGARPARGPRRSIARRARRDCRESSPPASAPARSCPNAKARPSSVTRAESNRSPTISSMSASRSLAISMTRPKAVRTLSRNCDAALARPERVGLEMDVGSMNDPQWSMRQLSWQNWVLRHVDGS